MRRRQIFRGLPIAGTAAAGVLIGHWLSYVLAFPEPRLRSEFLSASGHGYWLAGVKVAVVLFLAGLGTVALRHLGGRVRDDAAAGEQLSWLICRLGALQVVGFTAMEVTERIVGHASVGAMFQHHVFFLGLAVQVLVAAAGACILLWFGRAAAAVAAVLVPRATLPRSSQLVVAPATASIHRPALLGGGAGLRGPPSL